ncbi:MAG: motility associated factor glycosyltransferase family protein [Phycisphaerales bacterium]
MSSTAPVNPPPALDLSILERNLAALGVTCPQLALALTDTAPSAEIEFVATPAGPLSATHTQSCAMGTMTRALASRRDPLAEARRLADRVDVLESPIVAIVGFGLGYHVAEIASRVGRHGILVVFEPDLPLLRAVFERIDCSAWLERTNLIILTDPDDEGSLAGALRGMEGAIAMGVQVIEHPPSMPRFADSAPGLPGPAARFVQRFTRIIKAARTTIVTALVQTEGTLRNLAQNLDVYATAPGIADLAGAAAGRPAIVVSAGPSLWRNIDLLSDPRVRGRFVVIAVQTVLKPLLARGIRPDFVTALDFHEISRRFYEGLTPADVEGVTLVIEPKVNPAVPLAFPGTIRCAADPFLDRLLGEDLARPLGTLTPGATVAHLAYYLARHLACDPVILIGQDLGFTDGQYYSAGAAIHDVWAAELNEFNTLEMLEWQRIARMKGQLRRETDQLGRAIYTDEQMSTYLVQFQRDFKADADRGLRIIDATEGGVLKHHTTPMPLAAAIAQFAGAGAEPPPPLPQPPRRDDADRHRTLRAAADRVRRVRQDVWRVGEHCRAARALLDEMLAHQSDQARVNSLIARVEKLRDEVAALQPAFRLVETLNQTGAFNRHKTDRRLFLARQEGTLDPLQVQREQIQRDSTNVTWLADAADALGDILDDSIASCEPLGRPGEPDRRAAPKRTRDPIRETDQFPAGADAPATPAPADARVLAVIPVDPDRSDLGVPRDLGAISLAGRNPLQLTLARLARVRRLAGVTLLARNPDAARRLAGTLPSNLAVEFRQAAAEEPGWPATVARAARLWSADSWRGGLGNLTVYDEALWPGATLAALDHAGAHAALVLGADWGLIDPAAGDAIIERYQELPRAHRITFSQAAPGLAPCLIDRTMLAQIAERRHAVGSFASIGGVLGYVPTAPGPDLIVKPLCLQVPVPVRDCLHRCTLDSPARAAALEAALAAAALDPLSASSDQVAAAVSRAFADATRDRSRHVILRAIDARGTLAADTAALVLRQLGDWAPLSTVTIAGEASLQAGRGLDLLDHPDWPALVAAARSAGLGAVQLRTTLRAPESAVDALLTAGVEVLGIDLLADDAATYTALAGVDAFAAVRAAFKRLLTSRPAAGPSGVPIPWIVPRLTRRDAVIEQIEDFFDYWLLITGWAMIDPLPAPAPGERVAPLPLPALAHQRRSLSRVIIGTDGRPLA